MVRSRHYIPILFALIAFGLGIVGTIKRGRTQIAAQGVALQKVGDTATIDKLVLEKGVLYHLSMTPKYGVRLNESGTVAVSLVNAESGAELFNLEDAYWHQRGVWREGGESGTWEEQNSLTTFDFWVPEDATYALEIELLTLSMTQLPMAVVVEASRPFPLAEFPLYLGGLLLLGVAGWTWWRRDRVMAQHVKELGYGSRLRIGEDEYTVTRIYDYGYGSDMTASVEFELTHTDGITRRHLGVEVLEHYWEDSEDNEHTRYYHRLLIERPSSEAERRELEADFQRSSRVVRFDNVSYRWDEDNSGAGILTDWRGGSPATMRYQTFLFRTSSGLGPFPHQPGSIWIERIAYGGEEVEWAVMEIVDWQIIHVLEARPRPQRPAEAAAVNA